jgi:hypothetical protein
VNRQNCEPDGVISQDIENAAKLGAVQSNLKANKDKCELLLYLIRFTTELNNTRLYWLWIKYLMLAKIDANLGNVEQAEFVLKIFSPITDVLSYSLYIARLTFIFLYFIKLEKKHCSTYQYQAISDILWGLSNVLTAFYLQGSSIKPLPYTTEWYGHLSMQILLVYDVAILGVQYALERPHPPLNYAKPEIVLEQLDKHYYKKSLLMQLSYASTLSLGYFLFRGLLCNSIPITPLIGAGICVGSTMLANSIEWINLQKKYRQLQHIQGVQKPEYAIKLLMSLPILLHILFPLILFAII